MKEILQELSRNDNILGSFYFKGNENLSFFTEAYTIPESRIKRIALVLIQTMDALGSIAFDRFLLEGADKRVSIYKYDGGYLGVIFESRISFSNVDDVYQTIISKQPAVEIKKEPEKKVKEIPKEKPVGKPFPKAPVKEEKILSPSVFEKMKEILSQYLGDFSETIFENQMSDSRIDPDAASFSKVQKMCFGLQKASSMLIGPSQAKEMVDKLLALIKSEK